MAVDGQEEKQREDLLEARDHAGVLAGGRVEDRGRGQSHLEADHLTRDIGRGHDHLGDRGDGQPHEDLSRQRERPAERFIGHERAVRKQRSEHEGEQEGQPRAIGHGHAPVSERGRPREHPAEPGKGQEEGAEVPRQDQTQLFHG